MLTAYNCQLPYCDLAPCITKQQRGKIKNKTSKDRPAVNENLPPDMRFR